MLDKLYEIDKFFFLLINKTWSNSFYDVFFVFITEKNNWLIPSFVLLLLLAVYGEKKGRIAILLFLFSILVSDQLTSNFLKDIFMRLRPCFSITDTRQLVNTGNFSFPSSHSANAASVAIIASIYYPKFDFFYWIIVFLISYSRIYVGVHYPSDVLAGVIIGIICALTTYKVSTYFYKEVKNDI